MRHDFSTAEQLPPDPEMVTLQSALGAIAIGNFDALKGLMTEDVEMLTIALPEISGHWRGQDAVAEAAKRNFSLIERQKPEMRQLVTQPRLVIALVEETGGLNGCDYRIRGTIWYHFAEDYRIKRIEQYFGAYSGE